MKCLEPGYKIPCRKYFNDTVLAKIISIVKAESAKRLDTPEMDVTPYSFTSDI